MISYHPLCRSETVMEPWFSVILHLCFPQFPVCCQTKTEMPWNDVKRRGSVNFKGSRSQLIKFQRWRRRWGFEFGTYFPPILYMCLIWSGKWKWNVMALELLLWLNGRLIGWLLSFLSVCRLVGCLVPVLVRDDEQCLEIRCWQLSDYSTQPFDKPASPRKLMSLKCLYLCLSFHSSSLKLWRQQYLISLCIYSGDSDSLHRAELFVYEEKL